MSRRVQIAVTLVLFTAVMAVWGMVVSAWTPDVHAWLLAHIGRAGIWAAFILIWVVGGVLLYRERGIRLKGK